MQSCRERPCEDKKERMMWVNREEGKNIEREEKESEGEAKEFQERKREKKRVIRKKSGGIRQNGSTRLQSRLKTPL